MKFLIAINILCNILFVPAIAQISYDTLLKSKSEKILLLNNQVKTLPVELIYFYAIIQPDGILLKWGTATEVNNFGFEIERAYSSTSSWETVDFVVGSGTSNVPIDYEYLDSTANMSGIVFYRLKQIDIIGSFEYSDTVIVDFINSVEMIDNLVPNASDLLQNFPNPFNSTTNFQINISQLSTISFELFDTNGQKIKTLFNGELYPGTYSYQLNMDDFSSGTYLVKFNSRDYSLIRKISLLK